MVPEPKEKKECYEPGIIGQFFIISFVILVIVTIGFILGFNIAYSTVDLKGGYDYPISYTQATQSIETIKAYKAVEIMQVFAKDGYFLCDTRTTSGTNMSLKTRGDSYAPRPGEWWELDLGYNGDVVLTYRTKKPEKEE